MEGLGTLSDWLTAVYLSNDYKEKDKLPEEYMKVYYSIMLSKGNIFIAFRDDKPAGWLEVLRLDFRQLGLMACGLLNTAVENTTYGPIAYVKDDFTLPEYRGTGVLKELIKTARKAHPDRQFEAWHRNRGKREFVVYRRKING